MIHQTMSKDYRVAEYPEITALTPKVEEILQFGAEQEIEKATHKMSGADVPWTARKALKVWREL